MTLTSGKNKDKRKLSRNKRNAAMAIFIDHIPLKYSFLLILITIPINNIKTKISSK
jgi:hypothetical protein